MALGLVIEAEDIAAETGPPATRAAHCWGALAGPGGEMAADLLSVREAMCSLNGIRTTS